MQGQLQRSDVDELRMNEALSPQAHETNSRIPLCHLLEDDWQELAKEIKTMPEDEIQDAMSHLDPRLLTFTWTPIRSNDVTATPDNLVKQAFDAHDLNHDRAEATEILEGLKDIPKGVIALVLVHVDRATKKGDRVHFSWAGSETSAVYQVNTQISPHPPYTRLAFLLCHPPPVLTFYPILSGVFQRRATPGRICRLQIPTISFGKEANFDEEDGRSPRFRPDRGHHSWRGCRLLSLSCKRAPAIVAGASTVNHETK